MPLSMRSTSTGSAFSCMSVSFIDCRGVFGQQLQFLKIRLQALTHDIILNQIDTQPQPGDRGFEIMGNGPEHLIPVADVTLHRTLQSGQIQFTIYFTATFAAVVLISYILLQLA